MKITIIAASFVAFTSTLLIAGSINVVHLGPQEDLKFEVSAGDASQDFELSNGADTGPFLLPAKPAKIKGFVEGIPALDIPVSENPRIAILIPDPEGFKWHLVTAKPTPEKWAFRIVNLSSEPVVAQSGDATLDIPAGEEIAVDVTEKNQLRVQISDMVDLAYTGNEPRGVVAFIYRKNDQWHAICLPDR